MARSNGSHGGARTPGPGKKLGPPKRNLHISKDAAQSLRILMLNARGARNRADLTEEQIVEELIETAWRQLDAEYSAGAEAEAGLSEPPAPRDVFRAAAESAREMGESNGCIPDDSGEPIIL